MKNWPTSKLYRLAKRPGCLRSQYSIRDGEPGAGIFFVVSQFFLGAGVIQLEILARILKILKNPDLQNVMQILAITKFHNNVLRIVGADIKDKKIFKDTHNI